MSMSKHVAERINKIEDKPVELTIPGQKIFDVCKITYENAISIEIINHLLGGENMEYFCMELENSFECDYYCRQHLLGLLKNDKREICFFEDHKNSTSNILIAIVKQPKSKTSREHLVLYAVIWMTLMMEPKVAIMRYFDLSGMFHIFFQKYIYEISNQKE